MPRSSSVVDQLLASKALSRNETCQFNFHDIVLMLPEEFLLGAVCAILLVDLFLKPAQRDDHALVSIAAPCWSRSR